MITKAASVIRRGLRRICQGVLDCLVLVFVLAGCLVLVLEVPGLLVSFLVIAWTLWCDGD